MFNPLRSTYSSNSTDPVMSNHFTGDGGCHLETRPGDRSLTEFDADDLLNASMLDDSGGSFDDEFSGDFEPTPMDPNPAKVQSNQLSQIVSMFEPTPIPSQQSLPQKQLPPARTRIDGQGFPIARADPIASVGLPQQMHDLPNPMAQNQLVQAALHHLRHVEQMSPQQAMKQQQAMMAMNGMVSNNAPIHRPAAPIQSTIRPPMQHMRQETQQQQAMNQQQAMMAMNGMVSNTAPMHRPAAPIQPTIRPPMQHMRQEAPHANFMHQQQAMMAMNGMVNNTAPMHRPAAPIQPTIRPPMQHMRQEAPHANFMHQQQAMMAMNGMVNNTVPMHRPAAPIQPPMQLKRHEAPHANAMHHGAMSAQQQGAPSQNPDNVRGYSHAMEKLCDTMKRSAMSRTMVKQLSGRSLTKQGSQRSLSSQGSQRSQNSSRDFGACARLASGRDSARYISSSSLVGDETHPTGRLTPSRRSLVNTKHRAAPGQVSSRRKSSSALQGNRSTSRQLDDANLGWSVDDTESVCSGDTRFSFKTV